MTRCLQFTVIVPTCDRPEELAACLSCLAPGAQTLPSDRYDVIVTDDGMKPVDEWLAERFPWARWTRGPRRGPAANRNHGASLARGDWLAFTDDDCRPDPGWLTAIASAATEHPAVRVIEGRTYVDRPRAHPREFSPVNSTGGFYWSCNLALRRDAFEELGGFDERFPFNAMEDMELAWRFKAKGWPRHFAPAAGVLHPWRLIADWPTHARRHRASQELLESIHPGAGYPHAWPRLARTYARVVLTEHLGWLLRRPIVSCRALPALWGSMAADLWHAAKWRRSSRC
jgi:GT2 family glycosyltransferase